MDEYSESKIHMSEPESGKGNEINKVLIIIIIVIIIIVIIIVIIISQLLSSQLHNLQFFHVMEFPAKKTTWLS